MAPTYMPPTIEEMKGYICIGLKGTYTFDSTVHALQETLERSARTGIKKALLDMTELEGSISDNDRHRFADLLRERSTPDFHLAVLRTERTGPPTNILEEAASKVDRKAKAFFDRDEAMDWLGVKEPAKKSVKQEAAKK